MPGFLILILIFAVLAVAIVFISNQEGGWQGGCGGNCAACRHRCEQASDPDHTENKSSGCRLPSRRDGGPFLCRFSRALRPPGQGPQRLPR